MQTIDFSKLPLKHNDNILDLGCGEGRHAIGLGVFMPALNICAVDINFTDLKTGHIRYIESNPSTSTCFIHANGEQLPFADHSFDHIICSEVLEHLIDYQHVVEEIHRVLKPGGTLNISVPRYWPEKICWLLSRDYHEVEGGHVRIFKYKEIRHVVNPLSYQFRFRHFAHGLHVPYWWLKCLFWKRPEDHYLIRCYHKLLLWDLFKRPPLTRILESLLNPIMGKSVVLYFQKRED